MNASEAQSASAPSGLVVRKPPFRFGPQTPFQWNKANPEFGMFGNAVSFVAPSFEQYLVNATRDALPHITDPAVAAEAELFLRQEAVHSRMHRLHIQALVAQYPALAAIKIELDRRYDELFATKPLAFHLAYAADVEATFTPMFNILLRHRETLFDNGDSAVASLLMWHFVEEIEHRSSAFVIFNAVVPNRWYRVRVLREVFAHLMGCVFECFRVFDECVPKEERLVEARHLTTDPAWMFDRMRSRLPRRVGGRGPAPYPGQFDGIPAWEKAKMVYRLVAAQHPGHSPEHEECPPFADHWMAEYTRGRDVTHWYESAGA